MPHLDSANELIFTAPVVIKDLLSIDFRYARVYIYSLALQAVAERKRKEAHDEFLSSILDLHAGDYEFIQDVIDGCKDILSTVLKLCISDHLKYLPVRIYIRTVSACIFLLKVSSVTQRVRYCY